MTSVRLAALGALAIALPVVSLAGPGQVPTDFIDQLSVDALDHPVGMAFLPDGRLLVIELNSAKIRMIVQDALAATDPVGVVDSVATGGERGLLGIAVDPGWPARPYVYVSYNALGGFMRISRLTATGDLSDPMSGNLSIGAATRHDLIRDIVDNSFFHNGSSLRFGTDGKLLASLGDDEFTCSPQDVTSLHGMILRMDVASLPPGPGIANKTMLVPPDNPLVAHANVNARLLWSNGLRNPFRIAVDPVSGSIFVADVGWNTQDEIDVADGPGINFGWPLYEATHPYGIAFPEDSCGLDVVPPLRGPIHWYANSPTQRICVIGGPVYRPVTCSSCHFPPEYYGDYFFSDYQQGFLRRLKNTGGTWSFAPAVPGQPSSSDWGRGFQEVTDWAVGPDGALWYARKSIGEGDGTGEIRRIVDISTTGVDPAAERVFFAAPAPTPARGQTSFTFTLPRIARVELVLHDALGRRVRLLHANDREPAGTRTVRWDGLDERGRAAPSGLYVARLVVDGRRLERRLPLLR